jgi:hypothetical protein
MTVELSEVNPIFENLDDIKLKIVNVKESPDYYDVKSQGEEGEKITTYHFKDNIFLQVTEISDSYADNFRIKSISFVTPVIKEVQVWDNHTSK